MKTKPDIFFDPPEVQLQRVLIETTKNRKISNLTTRHNVGPRQAPTPAANPAQLAGDLFKRLCALPAAAEFLVHCQTFAGIADEPGWKDESSPPKDTVPGAKPIDMASWGMAMTTATLITEAIENAHLPMPGIDPKGFICLNWIFGEDEFSLNLHPGQIGMTYSWQRVLDGAPRNHASADISDVISALKAFFRSCRVKVSPS